MPVNIERTDLRVRKIEKALHSAMFTLLNHNNFSKITVNSICNEALVSRATFYAHYADKYDMLKYWLINFQPYVAKRDETYEQTEELASQFLRENEMIIKNLLNDANNETLEIICQYILTILDMAEDEAASGESRIKYTVLSNFYSGGIIYYLTWQIKNKFPSDIPTINIYLYKVIEKLREVETA